MFNNIFDIVAATMAIIGSFLLRTKNESVKIIAFTLFILADLLYAFIGYDKNMLFFMTQSIFFLFTSSYGIYNSINTMKGKHYLNSSF